MDTSLLTSTDSRYIFWALDAIANLGMRGQDSRLILSRGFGSHQTGGIRLCTDDDRAYERVFHMESVDSRPNVNKLAAAMGTWMPGLFFTHTCSMRNHFGIRILKRWLDNNLEAVRKIASDICPSHNWTYNELKQLQEEIMESSCSLALRCWANVAEIYMTYITRSPERPIGEITHSWWKHELQEMKANLSHIHSVLWLADNDGTDEGKQRVVNHIRGSISTIVKYGELKEYLESGLVSSYHDLISMLDDFSRILAHKHNRRCAIPVRSSIDTLDRRTVNNVGAHGDRELTTALQKTMRCKVPDNRLLSPIPTRHTYIDLETLHSPDAISVLKMIGLITYPSLSEAEQNDIE